MISPKPTANEPTPRSWPKGCSKDRTRLNCSRPERRLQVGWAGSSAAFPLWVKHFPSAPPCLAHPISRQVRTKGDLRTALFRVSHISNASWSKWAWWSVLHVRIRQRSRSRARPLPVPHVPGGCGAHSLPLPLGGSCLLSSALMMVENLQLMSLRHGGLFPITSVKV